MGAGDGRSPPTDGGCGPINAAVGLEVERNQKKHPVHQRPPFGCAPGATAAPGDYTSQSGRPRAETGVQNSEDSAMTSLDGRCGVNQLAYRRFSSPCT